ncbi:anthranilate synthase component II [Aestuariispira insulae]|uniref:Anthranilate synthase component II n=1 Tax=Aestuariispira insulae TaxID=1461337 RepID=A0A3D9HUW6_9PROT|nr:aminodeoxychorismate/anthranilate synthase component II [Aestuariispira insulae]RED53278.1 anthranilate synthase component II [Aestuariispira insulae]
MFVLIDNYDSFTYNLVHYLGELGADTQVHRNDKITVAEILALKPEGVVLSPGPCDPDRAGICLEMVTAAAEAKLPLFGVCLGHQTIGQSFGGKIIREKPMHGKVSPISHASKGIFADLPDRVDVTRYHSLVVEKDSLPNCLEITAETDDGSIMGLQHTSLPIHGVQFHPESIASQGGYRMIENFLTLARQENIQ